MAKESGTKTEFCKSLEWKIEVKWLDKTGFHKLHDGRVARIELESQGTSGEYPGFLVTILNVKEGKVDSKYFQFDDYIDTSSKGRTDGRAYDDSTSPSRPAAHAYPSGGKGRCFTVIVHNGWNYTGWSWYIANPRTTRPFCEAIEEYIELFAK